MKKRLKVVALLGVVLMVIFAANLLLQDDVLAGGLTVLSVDMNDDSVPPNNVYTVNTDIETTTIVFTPETEINTDGGIQIDFQSDFVINAGIALPADVTVTQANGGDDLVVDAITRVDADTLQIDILTESDTPLGAVTIAIINGMLKTPTTTGSKKIDIATYDLGADGDFGGADDVLEDAGSASVLIATNQVTISGTVDPALTLTLSDVTCPLGTLDVTNIETCTYDATVGTNATNGYSGYIRQEAGLLNAAADEITATASGFVTSNGTGSDEEYGLGVETQDTIDVFPDISPAAEECIATYDDQSGTALPADPLTTSDQRFATYAGPTSDGVTHGKTKFCHGASIVATTPAGVYSQTVTLTVVGNF